MTKEETKFTSQKLKEKFKEINSALEAFVTEMRRHSIWEQVMIPIIVRIHGDWETWR